MTTEAYEFLIWMALLAGILLPPIVHWRVRRTSFWGVRAIIAGLVFAPGLCVTAWLVLFYLQNIYWVNRWSAVYVLQGEGAVRCLAVVSAISAIYLGVCLLFEDFPRWAVRDGEDKAVRVLDAWRPLVVTQLALMAATAYVYHYDSLGDAVPTDNLALAEKRLAWNLEGLGPNNGLVVKRSASVLGRYPLLPVAVKNGNYDMVKLLVKHGADLNPKDWDEDVRLPSGVIAKNTLYFAVRNHDIEMIGFLIDLGANPEQGIYPALTERDQELLDFFLEKGASQEFALGVAERMGWKRQKIDRYFSDYTLRRGGRGGPIGIQCDWPAPSLNERAGPVDAPS